MDITYTSEWDAKLYERVIDASLRVTGQFRTSFFGWCMTVCGLLWLCIDWMQGCRFEGLNMAVLVVVLLPVFSFLMRRLQTRRHVKALQRLMGDEKTSRCRLTDEGYEVSCGSMSQKMPWKTLAESFKFLDGDTVAMLQPKALPTLVLQGLSKHGIDAVELKDVLLRAGVREYRPSRLQKIWTFVSEVVGILSVLFLALCLLANVLIPECSSELVVRNESVIGVDNVRVSFGREVIVFAGIPALGMRTKEFRVRRDCTCRAVATLADGSVVSNAYGYYCRGMDIGRVEVVVTADRSVKIIDKYNREDWRTLWREETRRWLCETRLPAIVFNAPVTMAEFVTFMEQASKDYDRPDKPKVERGLRFSCSDKAGKIVFPPKPKDGRPIIETLSVADMSLWDALTNACELTGCRFDIYGGTVEIHE